MRFAAHQNGFAAIVCVALVFLPQSARSEGNFRRELRSVLEADTPGCLGRLGEPEVLRFVRRQPRSQKELVRIIKDFKHSRCTGDGNWFASRVLDLLVEVAPTDAFELSLEIVKDPRVECSLKGSAARIVARRLGTEAVDVLVAEIEKDHRSFLAMFSQVLGAGCGVRDLSRLSVVAETMLKDKQWASKREALADSELQLKECRARLEENRKPH